MNCASVFHRLRSFRCGLPLLCAAGLLFLGSGCKLLEVKFPGEPLSKEDHQLRSRTREFISEFAATVQGAADGIAASTTNARTRAAAVQWKLGATGAIRRAGLRPSPTLALVDSWALCAQMRGFFEAGAGVNLFGGPLTARSLTNVQALERRVAKIAEDTLSGSKLEEMRKFVADYAGKHPLKDLAFDREPVAGRWEEWSGAPAVVPVGSSAEALTDLSDRVQIMGEQLPSELRWRVGLQVGELEQSLAELRVASKRVEEGLTRIADVAAGGPAMISNAVLELRSGFVPVFGGLEKQWAATVTSLQTERAALARDISTEREAILKAVDQQRAAVMKEVDLQRGAIMKDVERMAGDVTDRSMNHLRGLVKDVLLYGVVLVALVLGLPFFFGFLVGRGAERRKAGTGTG